MDDDDDRRKKNTRNQWIKGNEGKKLTKMMAMACGCRRCEWNFMLSAHVCVCVNEERTWVTSQSQMHWFHLWLHRCETAVHSMITIFSLNMPGRWTNAKSWVKMNADHSCEWECMCEVRNIRKHATDVNYDYMVKVCCTEHEMNLSHNKNKYFSTRMDIEWVWRAWTELRTHSARILCMTWVRLIISCNKWMWCVI